MLMAERSQLFECNTWEGLSSADRGRVRGGDAPAGSALPGGSPTGWETLPWEKLTVGRS